MVEVLLERIMVNAYGWLATLRRYRALVRSANSTSNHRWRKGAIMGWIISRGGWSDELILGHLSEIRGVFRVY